MPPDSQYSMPLHYQFVFHTKPENYKKKELMIYVALATKPENYKKKGIDDTCGTSYKTRKLQKKKELMIYMALATKLENYKKK